LSIVIDSVLLSDDPFGGGMVSNSCDWLQRGLNHDP
jgi:hypothetical protein